MTLSQGHVPSEISGEDSPLPVPASDGRQRPSLCLGFISVSASVSHGVVLVPCPCASCPSRKDTSRLSSGGYDKVPQAGPRTQQDLASRVLDGGPGPGERPPAGCRCQFLAAAWCGGEAAPGSQASAYEGTNLTREGSTLMLAHLPKAPGD